MSRHNTIRDRAKKWRCRWRCDGGAGGGVMEVQVEV